MAERVIKAEKLGKSYIIGHERRGNYTALRDVITNKARKILKKTSQLIHGGELIAGNEFEEFWALKDIDFEIHQGDSVGIIGRNGAGKSTLLKILSRITQPTCGRVTLNGRVACLLEVGTGFHPELTGRENIFLNGSIMGMSRAEIKSKFDEIVDFSGVEKFLDTPVKRFSSGMYVRLAFSVAAHLESEILIVDEVLAVGDAEFQKKCLNKMGEVSKGDGRTVLFVSHNLASIKQLCSKGFLLDRGRIIYEGSPQMTIDNYLLRFQNTGINNKFVKNKPENKDVELICAEILDGEGNSKDQFEIFEEIYFRLTFKCIKQIPNLYGYVAITNVMGDLLIETDTFDCLPNILDKMVKGENTYKLRLNSNILAYGEYILYVSLASTFADNFMIDIPGEILRFNIIDSETKRGLKRTSKTSYLIKWELENVS